MDGLTQAFYLRSLLQKSPDEILLSLEDLFASILRPNPVVSLVSAEKNCGIDAIEDLVASLNFRSEPHISTDTFAPDNINQKVYFIAPFHSSYSATSFKTVSYSHEDSAALRVLAKLLSSKYLLREVREKNGAYGGGVRFSPMDGIFSFYSYRDPNPLHSIQCFVESIEWAKTGDFSEQVNRFSKLKGHKGN